MDLLGTVEEVTTDGRLIVRSTTAPEYGSGVFDSKQKKIGIVKRVFGPVDGPYVSVTPQDKTVLNNAIGKKLYFEEVSRNVKNKRRN